MSKGVISLLILWFAFTAIAFDCTKLNAIREYIKVTWGRLRRSNATLLRSATDSKVKQGGEVALYVPEDEDPNRIAVRLRRELTPAEFSKVRVLRLAGGAEPAEPGLLYLPLPYVVPGGRFNEMYGWDSYFILLGLLQSGELALAKDMTDNFVYEVSHYGKVLNANRTYYLTRSQPPFLTRMILEVYRRTGDRQWLKSTLQAVGIYYSYWTHESHFTRETGLSRYYGGAGTPAPEVITGEPGYYDRVREYFRTASEPALAGKYLDTRTGSLTPAYYIADGAMRESGFDISSRFGPFSVEIASYNPVDLNCLLYRMEMDTAAIYTILGMPREAAAWSGRGERRAAVINRLMWNHDAGLYFDYNFKTGRKSDYHFITTFYPLWAGIASPEQAARVAANLPLFERRGGLQTSDRVTGEQWDAPFGWAPMQLIAVEGLRNYGFTEAADRISSEFLSMLLRDFTLHGTIVEKYDVVAAASNLTGEVKFGYLSNEIGFGWTNAVFLVLDKELCSHPAAIHTPFIETCRCSSTHSEGRKTR